MRYVGLLAFADLLQVHLWLAIVLGVVFARRWRQRWAAFGVAAAFYSAATSALSLIGWTPSGYLVVMLGWLIVDGQPQTVSRSQVYTAGIASVFVIFCGVPTGVGWLLHRRRVLRASRGERPLAS